MKKLSALYLGLALTLGFTAPASAFSVIGADDFSGNETVIDLKYNNFYSDQGVTFSGVFSSNVAQIFGPAQGHKQTIDINISQEVHRIGFNAFAFGYNNGNFEESKLVVDQSLNLGKPRQTLPNALFRLVKPTLR